MVGYWYFEWSREVLKCEPNSILVQNQKNSLVAKNSKWITETLTKVNIWMCNTIHLLEELNFDHIIALVLSMFWNMLETIRLQTSKLGTEKSLSNFITIGYFPKRLKNKQSISCLCW